MRKCEKCYGLGIVINVDENEKINICSKCNGKRYLNKKIELKFNSKFKNFIFYRKSHEFFNIIPGNIYLNLIPKNHHKYSILNFIDLIYNHNCEIIDTLELKIEFKHLDNKFYQFKITQ